MELQNGEMNKHVVRVRYSLYDNASFIRQLTCHSFQQTKGAFRFAQSQFAGFSVVRAC
jgi:hypothetical protein